jgi:ketosteroid isomerase-like protein
LSTVSSLNLRLCWVGLLLLPFAAADAVGQTVSTDTGEVKAVIEGFHQALIHADRAAALALLSPDALILESGESQTREEYEREHLAEDIAFARATTTERSPLIIRQDGNVAWTTATSKTTGTFKGHKIDSTGVELLVLTKGDSGWRIRAIHWSSQRK